VAMTKEGKGITTINGSGNRIVRIQDGAKRKGATSVLNMESHDFIAGRFGVDFFVTTLF
jgi:hypothetical protein